MNRHDKIKKIIKKLDQNNFSGIIFPIVRRVTAQTIGMGGETKERIEKRSRIQKLKRILSDEEFSEIVDEETYKEILEIKNEGGLISVQPLSGPIGHLMYIDFVYGEKENSTTIKMNIFKKISIWFKKIFNKIKLNKKKSKNYG
jgi:hypothetical protein